jgi:hypothetical protein
MRTFVVAGALLLVLHVLPSCASRSMSVEEHFHRLIAEQTRLVDQHVKDPKKHERLMRQVDRADVVLRGLTATLEQQREALNNLMRDYDATQEDYDAIRVRFDAEHEKALDDVLDVRGEMRKLMTREEWVRTSRRQYRVLGQ